MVVFRFYANWASKHALTCLSTGRLRSEVQTLTFLYTIFDSVMIPQAASSSGSYWWYFILCCAGCFLWVYG